MRALTAKHLLTFHFQENFICNVNEWKCIQLYCIRSGVWTFYYHESFALVYVCDVWKCCSLWVSSVKNLPTHAQKKWKKMESLRQSRFIQNNHRIKVGRKTRDVVQIMGGNTSYSKSYSFTFNRTTNRTHFYNKWMCLRLCALHSSNNKKEWSHKITCAAFFFN